MPPHCTAQNRRLTWWLSWYDVIGNPWGLQHNRHTPSWRLDCHDWKLKQDFQMNNLMEFCEEANTSWAQLNWQKRPNSAEKNLQHSCLERRLKRQKCHFPPGWIRRRTGPEFIYILEIQKGEFFRRCPSKQNCLCESRCRPHRRWTPPSRPTEYNSAASTLTNALVFWINFWIYHPTEPCWTDTLP